VHEVGHAQSLYHVFCPQGGSDGNDPSYPHQDGFIGAYGLDLLTGQLYKPTSSRDYMSYCSPPWASDWTWRKTWDHITALTVIGQDFDAENGGNAANWNQEIISGILAPDGTASWTTTLVMGGSELGTDGASITYYAGDEALGQGSLYVAPIPDMESMLQIRAAPGVDLDEVTHFEWNAGDETYAVNIDDVNRDAVTHLKSID